jgi:lipoyl(octanoyl) transferase
MNKQVLFQDLGKDQPYKKVWDYQEVLLERNVTLKAAAREAATTDTETLPSTSEAEQSTSLHPIKPQFSPRNFSTVNYLLFVEHSPVYTLGKSGDISHVLISEDERELRGIEFFKINRGGDITFHGPQQLVGYPIIDLEHFKTDLGWYLRSLEEVIILTMAEYGLKGERSVGETGVWLEPNVPGRERKICAMGIRCSRWITMHGFAFNINTDLNYFDYIVPCGIQNKQVTSLRKELGYDVPFAEVQQKVLKNFEVVFGVAIVNEDKFRKSEA